MVLIGTVTASVGAGDLVKFVAFVGLLFLVHPLLFLLFLDVSTECTGNFVGFVAYAL